MSDPSVRPGPAREPWSERVVDAACFVFALWTLCCHAGVAIGGSLWLALGVFAAAGTGVLFWLWRPRAGTSTAAWPPAEPAALTGAAVAPGLVLRVGGAALGVAGAWLLRGNPVALWWLGLVLLGVASVFFVLRERLREEAPVRSGRLEAAPWLMGIALVGVALVAHRVDLDDSFYLNLAVASADAPGEPLLAGDTLHGVPGLPLHHPVYAVHSWELWNAALSLLTGIPVTATFHLLSAAIAALLVPLAWARLFRRLAPRHWLWAVVAVLWVLLVAGDVHRWYGNFAFVRIWQGKSVFLSVLLPVIWSAALDFARRPSRRAFWLLAAAQVAAVGCTSTALWAGPAAALSAAACAVPLSPRAWRRIGAVALTSAYVLLLGLGLQHAVVEEREMSVSAQADRASTEQAERKRATAERRHVPGAQLTLSLDRVTGTGLMQTVCVAAVLGAWALIPPGLGRRFACGVPLAVWSVLLNPYFSYELARFVIGGSSWRALWVLPIPALLALVLTAPLQLSLRRSVAVPLAVAAFLGFAFVPAYSALSRDNGVRLGRPGPKVPIENHAIARHFAARVPPGSVVVAPRRFSVWLPTFHDRLFPLIGRDAYLIRFQRQLGGQNLALRALMTDFVSGRSEEPDAARHFALGLRRFGVAGVLVSVRPETAAVRRVLREFGFERVAGTKYEIWLSR